MNPEQYRDQLIHNKETLANLESGRYPALVNMFEMCSGKYLRRLNAMLEVAIVHESQIETPWRRYAFFMDENHYSAAIGVQRITFHNTAVLFECVGLLSRIIPTEEKAESEHEKVSIERAKTHGPGWRAITYWSFPFYDENQLCYMNQKAQIWIDKGHPATLMRDTVFDILGQSTANRVFKAVGTHKAFENRGHSRNYKNGTERLSGALERVFATGVSYAHKENIIKALYDQIYQDDKSFYFVKDCKRIWEKYSRSVLAKDNFAYRQATKAERLELGIRPSDGRWIITRKNNEDPK